MTVHIETYDPTAKTVEVTIPIARKRMTVSAVEQGQDDRRKLMLYGLAAKYQTGQKIWTASATYWFKSGNVNNVRTTNDHRVRRDPSIIGFYSDYEGKTIASAHSGQPKGGR